MSDNKKKPWKIFWDLQCPYSKKNWERLPSIKAKFEGDYEFSIHLTSLLFHPQAFTAQCAANLIASKLGPAAKQQFIDACFQNQESFMNAAVGDARKSEIDAIFATIAEQSGVLLQNDNDSTTTATTTLTKEEFLANLHDWDLAVKPAWTEHKEAMAAGVVATPKSVIDGILIGEAESFWGPDEWAIEVELLKNRKHAHQD